MAFQFLTKLNLLVEKQATDPRVISPRIILAARTSNKQISIALNNFFAQSNLNSKERQTTTDFVNGTIRMSRRLIFEIKNNEILEVRFLIFSIK